VKPWELTGGRFGRKSLINQVGDIPELHPRYFCHGFKLLYNLRVNMIQLRPYFRSQAAVLSRDLFGMGVPAVVQPALDYLVGLYLIAKELYSGLLVGSSGFQCASHGLEDLSLADAVIDGLAVRVLDRGNVLGQGKALDDQFEELAKRTLSCRAAAAMNRGLVTHDEHPFKYRVGCCLTWDLAGVSPGPAFRPNAIRWSLTSD
jgi:hypothetical protein